MSRRAHIVFGFLGSLLASSSCHAQGFLSGKSEGDAAFCDMASVRQTVVYVDDMFMEDGETEWANKIYDKLKATLVPGEHVSVVELSPADGQSHESWSGCWPDYPASQKEKLQQSYSFFSKNPIKSLEDQQGRFGNDFAGALSDIYDKHHHAKTTIDAASPPQKSILSALSSDGARYSQAKVTVRAIIFSDMAENSDLGSIYKQPQQPAPNFGRKLGTYFRGSVFYIFGVDADLGSDETLRENTKSFWESALRTMSGTIGGLGSDLNVPNAIPIAAYNYTIDLVEDNQPLSGRLSVLVDSDGTLVDSWIGIVRLSSAAINGSMTCDAGGDAMCTINATTSHGILSDSPTEVLTLRGGGVGSLKGLIGVKGSSVMFPLTATPTSPH